MQYFLLSVCIVLILAIIIKIKTSNLKNDKFEDNYNSHVAEVKYKQDEKYIKNEFDNKKNNIDILIRSKKYIKSFIVGIIVLLLIVFSVLAIQYLTTHIGEILILAIITSPIWIIILLCMNSGYLPKSTVAILIIVVVCVFAQDKVSSYFEKINNDKEKVKIENIKSPEQIEKKFNEFFKKDRYIPIEEFRTEILEMVQDLWSVNEVWVDVAVFGNGYNTDFLSIKPRTKQSEINEYIKRISKNKKIKYAHVDFNDDVLHTVTLTENNYQ